MATTTSEDSIISSSIVSAPSNNNILLVPPEPDLVGEERVHSSILGNNTRSNDDGDDNNDATNDNIISDDYPITCQVKIVIQQQQQSKGGRSGSSLLWTLISLDRHGNEKTIGGDEYYIAFTSTCTLKREDGIHPYTAVAIIEDCHDGTYLLDFVATPTSPPPPQQQSTSEEEEKERGDGGGCGGGRLTIYFQYSCGIGFMPSPTKKGWVNGAYTHRCHHVNIDKGPPIRPFIPPNNTLLPPPPPKTLTLSSSTSAAPPSSTSSMITTDLNQFDLIVAFGDSTMEQFVRQRPNKKGKYYFQNNISFGEKVDFALNTQTVTKFLDLLEQGSGQYLRDDDNDSDGDFPIKRRAVLLGSCLWDILDSKDSIQGSTNYIDHQKAIHLYLEGVRQRYPNVTILWKSPTAVHIHVVDLERLVFSKLGEAALFGLERIRYMSSSRSLHIYEIQKQIMKQHNIPFLDLYEATYLSADWLFPSDGRHYRPDLNRFMLSWFYHPRRGTYSNTTSDVNDDDDDPHQTSSAAIPEDAAAAVVEITSDDKGGMMLTIAKPYYQDPTHSRQEQEQGRQEPLQPKAG